MKKTLFLFLFIISSHLFSQTSVAAMQNVESSFDKMSELFRTGKYEEAEKIGGELLSNEMIPNNSVVKFYALYLLGNCYYFEGKYKKATESFQKLVEFDGSEVDKKEYKSILADAKDLIKDLAPKLSLDTSPESKISETDSVNGKSVSNISNAGSQENKTVTLIVSGTGKTIEESKTNALRSAIEQAFGAFISSKTEILNDNLVKDEIVSVTNGNIQKYDVISQVEIPNNVYAVTLNATVSVSKLTSFIKNKGVSIEIKGGTFAANIIQQEMNEKAELAAIQNILNTSGELLKKAFDYSIESNGDMTKMENGKYSIPLKVKVKLNKNFYQFRKYLVNSLSGLTMNETDVTNYEKLKKSVSQIVIKRDTLTHIENLFINKRDWLNGFDYVGVDIDNFNPSAEKVLLLGGTDSEPIAFEINSRDELKNITKNIRYKNVGRNNYEKKYVPEDYLYKVNKNDLGYSKIYLRNPTSIFLIKEFLINMSYLISHFEILDNNSSISGEALINNAKISNGLFFSFGTYYGSPLPFDCFKVLSKYYNENSIYKEGFYFDRGALSTNFLFQADSLKKYFPNLLSILPLKITAKTIIMSLSGYKENDIVTIYEFNVDKSLEEIKQLSEYKINPKN